MSDWTTPAAWDPAVLLEAGTARRRVGNPGSKTKKRQILDVLAAFDIETSPTPGRTDAHLYHWQLQIGLDTPTIHGRTWDDLRLMFSRICAALGDKQTLVIYVHNLSYEWQFLRTIYDFTNDDIFATGDRKILRAYMYDKKLEFRCSYLLTNMGLAAWTKKMGVAHPKLDSDEYDHNKVRWPWDDLTEEELRYCRHDVLGLCEALQAQMARDGDNLAAIPMTSTGYVRRDVKAAMQHWSRLTLRKIQPDPECFRALREEFRGGDTHANRYLAGEILEDVWSWDRSSSYPDVLVNCRYPMSPWRRWTRLSVKELHRLEKLDMALLMRVRFTGIRLKSIQIGDPPLSYSKCREVIRHRLDNGRILYAESLETTINDVDLDVYSRAYAWDDLEILAGWYSAYDWLPDPLRRLIITYYQRKTELKGVAGEELFYDLAKALLNAIYGMMAQDPVKRDIIFNGVTFESGPDDLEAKLAKHRNRAFTSYAWGCWCTSWARLRLYQAVELSGRDFVYCDTDSDKSLTEPDLSAYNAERIRDSKASGAYATDPAGNTHYMGVFEPEGKSTFITWGAKKYAYVKRGRLTITVAGVGKKKGRRELMRETLRLRIPVGCHVKRGPVAARVRGANRLAVDRLLLSQFKPGFIFKLAGGTESIYNDLTREVINVDGNRLELGPNIYIRPSTYTLGTTPAYSELLADPESWLEILEDRTIFEDFEHEFA